MAILFDPTDDRVRPILERAKASGTITYDDLNEMLLPVHEVSSEDIEDTWNALSAMGIEVVEREESEEEQAAGDAAFLASMRARFARGLPLPQLTPDGWNSLNRALEREKHPKGIRD